MGSYKAIRVFIKIISSSDKENYKKGDMKFNSTEQNNITGKNQNYSYTDPKFSATKENGKDLLKGISSKPSISIFGHGRIKTRSSKIKSSSRAASEAQPSLDLSINKDKYHFPPLALLSQYSQQSVSSVSSVALNENAKMLEAVLELSLIHI